jgi:hypothetical protein
LSEVLSLLNFIFVILYESGTPGVSIHFRFIRRKRAGIE